MSGEPDTFTALIAEAKRQPFRTIWRARAAWTLFRRWNAPAGDDAYSTLWQNWQYTRGLAEMLDDYGPMFPSEAIDSDREYWEH